MKIIKPFYLGTLTRPFTMHRQHRLGVAVFAVADYCRDGEHPRLDPDHLLWRDLLPQLDCEGMIDQFIPKPQAEYLVSGFATTEFAQQDNQCAVRVQVGELEKSLIVSGQRYWINGRLTAPESFERMEITWENAFGGPSFAENTSGKGADTITIDNIPSRLAPNVEHPSQRMGTADSKVEPASFGPIPLTRPSRFNLGGNYSEEWLKKDFPGFFPDLNPAIFNAASSEQRWAKRDRLPRAAPFTIWNMTPGQPYWKGELPDWQARCFVLKSLLSREDELQGNHNRNWATTDAEIDRKTRDHEQLIEIPLRATTAWFVPHEKKVILIYHGSLEIAEDDAADVKCIMPALELPGQARDTTWYQRVMEQRRDPENGGTYAFRDNELVPEELLNPLDFPDMEVTRLARWQKAIVRKDQLIKDQRAAIAESGHDPDDYLPIVMGPERQYSVQDIPDLIETLKALPEQAEQTKAESQAQMRKHSKTPELTEAIFANQIKAPPGPPRPIAEQIDELMQADLEQFADQSKDMLDAEHRNRSEASTTHHDQSGAKTETVNALTGENQTGETVQERDINVDAHKAMNDDAFRKTNELWTEKAAELHDSPEFAAVKRLERLEPLNRKMYLYSAQMQEGVTRVGAHRSEQMRKQVQKRYDADRNLSMMDLTGADLSGMQLSGADLSGAFMEAVDLSGANLSGCNLSEAVLARATLDDCDLSRANLNSANLSIINANRTGFAGASLDASTIEQSTFFECDFSDAYLAQLPLNKIRFEKCIFADAALFQCIYTECEFTENHLGARMTRTTFLRSKMKGNRYAGAFLDSSHFVESALQDEVFGLGKFLNVAMTYHTTVQDCSFAHAQFKQCNLRGLQLDGQDFTQADMSMTDLSEASLRGSTLTRMVARDTLFVRADLRHAQGEQANLIQATLTKANLENAAFSKANFFRANLGRARLDETSDLDRAYTAQANLYPIRDPKRRGKGS